MIIRERTHLEKRRELLGARRQASAIRRNICMQAKLGASGEVIEDYDWQIVDYIFFD
jgi:hypothetical protein